MQIIRFLWKFVWKTAVVVMALLLGALAANQAGWSGAESVINYPLIGMFEEFVTGIMFSFTMAVSVGAVFVVYKIAKPVLWVMVPILLYSAAVPGAWNGFLGDFDSTRVEAIKHGYANGYALEHMSDRGRFRTCHDTRIDLADDAKAVCARALDVAPGERIPGSEHRCGFLDMFGCFNTAPEK
jgi:hypothetical protein